LRSRIVFFETSPLPGEEVQQLADSAGFAKTTDVEIWRSGIVQ